MPSGRTCQSPAIKGQPLCFQHSRRRTLVEANRTRKHSIALPPLEDRVAIQMSLDEILAALSAGKISRREAATYLYALQLGMRNLSYIEQLPTPDPIHLCRQQNGDILAAEEPSTTAPGDSAQPHPRGTALDDPTSTPSLEPTADRPASDKESDSPCEPTLGDSPSDASSLDLNLCATHEYDPEPPDPPTQKELQLKRRQIELNLRNQREARAFYKAMPDSTPNEDPALVLTFLQKEIDKWEAELAEVDRLQAPDPPLPREDP